MDVTAISRTTIPNSDGGNTIRITRQGGLWMPYREEITDKYGNKTIKHKYANGLYVEKTKQSTGYKIQLVKHDQLLNPLYVDPKSEYAKKYSGAITLSPNTIEVYKSLPTYLKKLCSQSLVQYIRSTIDILNVFSLDKFRTTNKTHYIKDNEPVTIIETSPRTSDKNSRYKRRIIHSNGTITITHQYDDGLYVTKTKLNGNTPFEVTYVSKNGVTLLNKYCPQSQKDLIDLPSFRQNVEEAFKTLPTYLKKVCKESVQFLTKNSNLKI